MGLRLIVKVEKNKINIIENGKHRATIRTECKNNLELEFSSFGIFGIVLIGNIQYIIFISEAIKLSDIFDKPVYEIKNIRIIKITGYHDRFNTGLLDDLYSFFKLPGIYFSDFPLYQNFSYKSTNDLDFLFNYDCLMNLKKNYKTLRNLSVSCIQGFFDVKKINDLNVGIISRRSWRRIGSRYFSRGLGKSGYVSNFVETEVFLYRKDKISSFLQIRGSIPLNWSHKVNLKYMPDIKINPECHFEKSNSILESKYNQVFYLNLIKQKGYESNIFKKFSAVLNSFKQLHMNFDIANEGVTYCSNKEAYFINILSSYLEKFGIRDSVSFQKGIVRTNCIDCLDRTNLVQHLIANYMIKYLIQDYTNVELTDVTTAFKDLWYKNGNILSIQYSGTQAMKSFVLLGGNFYVGKLKDAYVSVKRYFINRWFHGRLQNAYDIITGNLKARKIHVTLKKSLCNYYIHRKIFLQFFCAFILYLLKDKMGLSAFYTGLMILSILFVFQTVVFYRLDLPLSSAL